MATSERQPVGLTILEAKALAGCGRSALYAEIKAGRLPARKLGRRTIILASELSAWLAKLPLING
jgi:excisionase family DNA binding protein